MCCENKMKIVAYTFCALTIVLIVLVIVLPIVLQRNIKSDYTDKTKPKIDNINLWAKFPGDIKTQTTHTFNVLDHTTKDSPKIKDSLILDEEIVYDNFNLLEKENKLLFDAKYQYKLTNTPKNESINTLNLGMFEALETISNPPKYQKGISSLLFLLNKAMPEPEPFIRQIITYQLFNTYIVDESKVRTTILNNISQDKANKILTNQGEYAKYSFKNMMGFYEWMKIMGNPEEISKAKWLSQIFDLTSNEIDSIIGKHTFLYNYYLDFNVLLAAEFKCEQSTQCGKELLLKEILTGGVLKLVNLEGGLAAFYQIFQPEYFPFPKSPDMNSYFEEYKKKINNKDIELKDYAPTFDQFNTMINGSFNTCLLSANNSVLFLSLNNSDNADKSYEYFKISKNVLNFLSDYIYEYLPSIFLYQEFKDEKGEAHTIHPIAKAFAAITQNTLSHTYKLLSSLKGIYNLILSKIIWLEISNKLSLMNSRNLKSFEPDEICPLIMQTALDDGRKVLKVCSDPQTAFDSPERLIKWFAPYYCVVEGSTGCDMTIINYLKTIIYITDDEIKAIYDENLLGGIFTKYDKILKDLYQCGDHCDKDEPLIKDQFWKSKLTAVLPSPYKSNTIFTLLPEKVPYPVEIPYFAEKLGESIELSEEEVDKLISLCPNGENVLSEENINVFETRINLEKELTLEIDSGKESDEDHKAIKFLNKGYLFNKDFNSTYKNLFSILVGNSDEDQKYVKYLSEGEIFENFKPKFSKTTGFNFGIDFSTGKNKSIDYDRYGLYGKQSKDRNTLRRIISINDFSILNIKKPEYNCLSDSYTTINSPIMNFQTLTSNKYFKDGFQYKADEEPIYFYDKISSRPLKFNYDDDDSKYKGIYCNKYILDKKNLANDMNEEIDSKDNKAFITQKLNKPFTISVGNKEIEGGVSEENYICVDPFTNMVLESKINLVYSLYTKQYRFINPSIENNKTVPIFTYQRNYHVDIDSYDDYFPNIKKYNTFKIVFLIVVIILIVVCAAISLWAFIKIHKGLIKEDIAMNSSQKEPIINDSRDPTLMNNSTQ